jgi:hypothetical protein
MGSTSSTACAEEWGTEQIDQGRLVSGRKAAIDAVPQKATIGERYS